METTFMTIHNVTPDANILFASESISEILGYQPYEVQGRSCFDYFHPDEVPFARDVHSRGVNLDKAAVLHYARIKAKDGQFVGCECVFTLVYDVLVACTSIYKQNVKSETRAADAPVIRRLFASSPRDPRYHMLEHLSAKFKTPLPQTIREPRAALILNRFSRTLTIMYATNSVSDVLGISPEVLKDKSFYECIQENCQPGAIRCIESAKSNDSIAYLRFWYRNPRRAEDLEAMEREGSHSSSDDDEGGGAELSSPMEVDSDTGHGIRQSPSNGGHSSQTMAQRIENARTTSGDSVDTNRNSARSMFDHNHHNASSTSSGSASRHEGRSTGRRSAQGSATSGQDMELEAVISCTSDGLVVILRRARPQIPSVPQDPAPPQYRNGLFAAPWGAAPIQPLNPYRSQAAQSVRATGGPSMDSFMSSIREVAVFAWSLTGINGNIAEYGHGTPRGEAVPPTGVPVWNPQAQGFNDLGPDNQARQRWTEIYQRDPNQYSHFTYESHLQQRFGQSEFGQPQGTGPSTTHQYSGAYITGHSNAHYIPRSLQDAYMSQPPPYDQSGSASGSGNSGGARTSDQGPSQNTSPAWDDRHMWY